MEHKLRYILAALLGFSTACSTVKNAPKQGEEKITADSVAEAERPRLKVMYGPPAPRSPHIVRMERLTPDSLGPVLEQPADDMPPMPTSEK